jgi:hypothetical protein
MAAKNVFYGTKPLPIDSTNPVVALCAAGMACEGDPETARHLFEEAWDTRRDDYDAAVAAHYLARHQPTPFLVLDWNARAVTHGERVTDGRATELLPSLYLNLGDSLLAVGRLAEARVVADLADEHLRALPADGYGSFVAFGIARLRERLVEIAPQASPRHE